MPHLPGPYLLELALEPGVGKGKLADMLKACGFRNFLWDTDTPPRSLVRAEKPPPPPPEPELPKVRSLRSMNGKAPAYRTVGPQVRALYAKSAVAIALLPPAPLHLEPEPEPEPEPPSEPAPAPDKHGLYRLWSDPLPEDVAERWRLFAVLERPLNIREGGPFRLVRSLEVPLSTDTNLNVEPFTLVRNVAYEARILARNKSTPGREGIRVALENMGAAPEKVCFMSRHARIPERPTVSVAIAWSLFTWKGPSTVTTPDDDLFFLNLKSAELAC